MKIHNISEFTRGWMIGNFTPSIIKTEAFEAALMTHKKGEKWPVHYHKIATEVNLVVSGSLRVQGQLFNPGDIFVLEPMEIADPEFLEDCQLMVIKTPSVMGDKYEVEPDGKLD